MKYNCPIFTLIFFLCLSLPSQGQQLVWIHKPFSDQEVPNYRYSQDTVLFATNSQILGLVYLPNADKDLPQISLSIKNQKGDESSASFDLQAFDPSQLSWHKHIKKWYQYLLKSPHWYYFEITPNPSVVDAKSGVDFLTIIKEVSQTSSSGDEIVSLFTYKIVGNSTSNVCAIDFSTTQGLFSPLWKKLSHYQNLLANKREVEGKQTNLVLQCEPQGFVQVSKWANKSKGLKSDLIDSDLDIFKAVENLKIITEAIPDSISNHLKRELRALLILDIAILETTNSLSKTKKIRQKKDLVKQLSLYPELNSILALYKGKNSQANSLKQTERSQEQELKEISTLFGPHEQKYKDHQKLQVKLNALNQQLEEFD